MADNNGAAPSRLLKIGDWQVDPQLDAIRRGAEQVKLEPRSMRLLCFLADRPGEVRSIDEILQHVWPGLIVGQNSVYQAVAQLRRALGDSGEESQYIASVPRRGYRLIAAVEQPARPEATGQPDPVADSVAAAPGAAIGARPRRWIAFAVLGIAVAIGTGGLLYQSRAARSEAPAAVAVLPFADLSHASSESMFAAGLTDEIINSLGRVPGLRITGRTSVYQVPKDVSDPRELGRLLGVTHLLLGSVRSAEGRVRVNARLINTRDGFMVWSNNYDRARASAIGVQTDIAREVVGSLQLRLTPQAQAKVGSLPTALVNAYDLYLLGRNQQMQRNPESLARAQEYHRQALALDPRFALAHAGLADASMATYYYANRPLADVAAQVEQSVQAALAIDPELAEAYSARAVLRLEQRRVDEAIADLQRAIAINSNVGEFYQRLGGAYEYAGRPRDALQTYEQVQSLDPLHTLLHVRRCLVLQNIGRYADAGQACGRAFELQPDIPNHLWAAGLNEFAQGNTGAAIRNLEQALARAPQRADIRGELALLLLDRGAADAAAREFNQAIATASRVQPDLLVSRLNLALLPPPSRELRLRLQEFQLPDDAQPGHAVALSYYALIAADRALADKWLRTAVALPDFSVDGLEPGVYAIRWGRCDLCQYAYLQRLAGKIDEADALERRMLARFEELEQSGHVWHGLQYLRASLQAQRGEADAALASLRRAVAQGWRRAWYTARDPALQPLHSLPEFERLLAQMRKSAA